MIETIRPTMSMVRDLLPGMRESWIFNDCAIGETENDEFIALIVVKVDGSDIYYGFQRYLSNKFSRYTTRRMLDESSEQFLNCPDAFLDAISWMYVKEGNRYV